MILILYNSINNQCVNIKLLFPRIPLDQKSSGSASQNGMQTDSGLFI